MKDGKLYSLDNRRLFVFKEAGINIKTVTVDAAKFANKIEQHFSTLQ